MNETCATLSISTVSMEAVSGAPSYAFAKKLSRDTGSFPGSIQKNRTKSMCDLCNKVLIMFGKEGNFANTHTHKASRVKLSNYFYILKSYAHSVSLKRQQNTILSSANSPDIS